jgi:hypothetical protein
MELRLIIYLTSYAMTRTVDLDYDSRRYAYITFTYERGKCFELSVVEALSCQQYNIYDASKTKRSIGPLF